MSRSKADAYHLHRMRSIVGPVIGDPELRPRLLYGIDSGLLAKELGVRVAKAGFYAGCGSEFAADYIVPYLGKQWTSHDDVTLA